MSQILIDGPRCPTCQHDELLYTTRRIYGWGLPDGSSETVRRDCPKCGWGEEGGWT